MKITSIDKYPLPIVILNWNGLEDTIACIKALEKQTLAHFHVYLVDNGSGGKDPEILRETFGRNRRITLIFNRENLGFTRGNNEVLKKIIEREAHSYIALLNNDTVPEPQWLEALVEIALANDADMVASRMVNFYHPLYMDNAGHFMLNTGEIIPLGHNEPMADYDRPVENIGACAGAALYKVDLFRELGLFDEYFQTGYEDAELGLRAFVAGKKLAYAPGAVVHHKISASVNKIRDFDYTLRIQLNIFYTFFKLMPTSVIAWQMPSWLFKYLAIFLIDILFFRIRFLKVITIAFYRFFRYEWPKTIQARRKFFKCCPNVLSSYAIRKKLVFFLWFDIKRFYKYVLLRKPTEFEKY